MSKTNPENINVLSTRIEEIDREIKRLLIQVQNKNAEEDITVLAQVTQLNELKNSVEKYKDLAFTSAKWKDGKISVWDNMELNKIQRRYNRDKERLDRFKQKMWLDGGFDQAASSQNVRAYDTRQLNNVLIWPEWWISLIKPESVGVTNADIRPSTLAEKKTAIDNIDAGKGSADDYKVAWMWYIDHVIQKNTHATPWQAKTMRYLAAGAWAFLIGKRALEDGFSMQTFAKLWTIYAGTTMATGMGPAEFVSTMFKWGHYPLLGIDPVAGSKEWKEKSIIAEQYASSQIWDGIINSIKPELLSKYLIADNGQVTIDMLKILNDVSIDGQPITNLADLKCSLSVDKINEIFRPHLGLTWQQIFSILLAPAQAGEIKLINQSLTTHFGNLEADNSKWSALLANPNDLVTRSNAFTEALTSNAVAQVKRLKTEAQYTDVLWWYTLVPWFELALIDEMLKMEKEIDPSKVINPSTYMLPVVGSFDYVKLKQRLIDKNIISVASLANNPDAKWELITTTMSLLAPYNFINTEERSNFAQAFVKVKADYDPQNHHQLELRVIEADGKSQLWIQNSTAAFALSGIDESTLNIDFGSMWTTVKWWANVAWWYQQKLVFAFASLELIGKAAGNIAHPKDKPQNANDTNRPFKVSGKSIALSTKTWLFDFGWDDKYDVVNKAMVYLDTTLWANKAGRMKLCAMLNGMRFQGGENPAALIRDINEWKLPEKMMPISTNGVTRKENAGFYAGREYIVESNPTLVASIDSFFGWVAKVWWSFYANLLKAPAKELYGDAVSAIKQIYKDSVIGTTMLYEDAAAWARIMLVDLKDGWSKLLFATTTQVGKDMLTSVVDITAHSGHEVYIKIVQPLYKEVKLQAPKLLWDMEQAIKLLYTSGKSWLSLVESDARKWLKTDWKKRYSEIFKAAGIELYKDASKWLDVIGKDIGAKLAWIGTWTVEKFFWALWLTADQASIFQWEYPKIAWLITWVWASMMWVPNGPSIIWWIAVAVMWMFK